MDSDRRTGSKAQSFARSQLKIDTVALKRLDDRHRRIDLPIDKPNGRSNNLIICLPIKKARSDLAAREPDGQMEGVCATGVVVRPFYFTAP